MGAWGKKLSLESIPKVEETIWKIFFHCPGWASPVCSSSVLLGCFLPLLPKQFLSIFPGFRVPSAEEMWVLSQEINPMLKNCGLLNYDCKWEIWQLFYFCSNKQWSAICEPAGDMQTTNFKTSAENKPNVKVNISLYSFRVPREVLMVTADFTVHDAPAAKSFLSPMLEHFIIWLWNSICMISRAPTCRTRYSCKISHPQKLACLKLP